MMEQQPYHKTRTSAVYIAGRRGATKREGYRPQNNYLAGHERLPVREARSSQAGPVAIDSEFIDTLIAHLKIFVFAGARCKLSHALCIILLQQASGVRCLAALSHAGRSKTEFLRTPDNYGRASADLDTSKTTAITLAYVYYLLERNPSALATIRAEHDNVFGPDPKRRQGSNCLQTRGYRTQLAIHRGGN